MDAASEKLFPHAKEGWVLLKEEADRLGKAYPRELMKLDRRALAEGKGPGDIQPLVSAPAVIIFKARVDQTK